MAENSRKNKFFERESIAAIAIILAVIGGLIYAFKEAFIKKVE